METKKKKSNPMTTLIVLFFIAFSIYLVTRDSSGINQLAFQWDEYEKIEVFQSTNLDSTYIEKFEMYINEMNTDKNRYFIVVKENKGYENFSFPFDHSTHEKFISNLLDDDNVIMTGIKFVNGHSEIAYKHDEELTIKPI